MSNIETNQESKKESKKDKHIIGILQIEDINLFKIKLNLKLKDKGYTGEINNEINKISIIKPANWIKTSFFWKEDNKYINETHYRIVIKHIHNNEYYFQKDGGLVIDDNFLNEYDYLEFNQKFWKNTYNKDKSIQDNVNEYLIHNIKNEIIDNKNLKELKINYDNFDFSINSFLIYYNKIQELESDKKLIPYIDINCRDSNNKSSETVYNELAVNSNSEKYLLLDRILINNIEVADIYDKENKLLFHNKKANDLRTLAIQVINGALIMKDDEKKKEYQTILIDKGISDIDNNFNFVVGIIIKEGKKISLKDIFSLGLACFILEQKKIILYKDLIKHI
jgi:hypothetical protein